MEHWQVEFLYSQYEIFFVSKPLHLLSAAQPAEICTTVPPAKSNAPILARNPSGCQLQCATGAYTNKAK